MASQEQSEEILEISLGRLLRAGVTIAAAVVLAGAIWFLWRYGGSQPEYGHFVAQATSSRSVAEVLGGIAAGQSRALIQLGLMLLIATPVARVFFSLILFARIRDYKYCVITAIVLTILLLSLTGI